MSWQWVNDLMAPTGMKKDGHFNAVCTYYLCPGQRPKNRQQVIDNKEQPLLPKPKMKFIYKVSPMVYHYQCGYCGCGWNFDISVPSEQGILAKEPGMWGNKPSYEFKRW